MAKFKFKMDNILNLKYKLEDQEKINYGDARRKLTEEETKLSELEQQKFDYEELYRHLISKELNLIQIRNTQGAIEVTKTKIKRQKVAVQTAEKALEVARIRLNKAMVERKTYEVLKDKAFEQFKRDLEAEEQKDIDELVSFQYNSPVGYEEDH